MGEDDKLSLSEFYYPEASVFDEGFFLVVALC